MGATYRLNWPGIPEFQVYVIEQNCVAYSSRCPIPLHKLGINNSANRYVRLSDIVHLSNSMGESMVHVLELLQKLFNVERTVYRCSRNEIDDLSQSGDFMVQFENRENVGKDGTFIPVSAFLALMILFPCCSAFKSTLKSIMEYLDGYSESICMACGFVRRDCCCHTSVVRKPRSFIGCSLTMSSKLVQTDDVKSTLSKSQQPSPYSLNLFPGALPVFPGAMVSMPTFPQYPHFGLSPNEHQGSLLPAYRPGSILPCNSDLGRGACSVLKIDNLVQENVDSVVNSESTPTLPAQNSVVGALGKVGPSQNGSPVDKVNFIKPGDEKSKEQPSSSVCTTKTSCKAADVLYKLASSGVVVGKFDKSKKRKFYGYNEADAVAERTDVLLAKKRKTEELVEDETTSSASRMKKTEVSRQRRGARQQENLEEVDFRNGDEMDAEEKESGALKKASTRLWKLLDDVDSCGDAGETENTAEAAVQSTASSQDAEASTEESKQVDKSECDGDMATESTDINSSPESKVCAKPGSADILDAGNEQLDVPTKLHVLTDNLSNVSAGCEATSKQESSVALKRAGVEARSPTDDEKENTSSSPSKRKLYGRFEYLPTGEEVYRCVVNKCGQCFEVRGAAELHCAVHRAASGDKTEVDTSAELKCTECDTRMSCFQWFDLVRHMKSAHDIRLSRYANSCKLCGLVFDSEEKLISHLSCHYSNRYKCTHCGLLLLTWLQVQKHMVACAAKVKTETNLGCAYCTFVFHKKSVRNLHMLSHTDEGLACVLCDTEKDFSNDWKLLRKHYQQKHSKVLQMKISPFRCQLPLNKKRPPPCSVCQSEYRTADQLAAHMRSAHIYVPAVLMECGVCGKQFRTSKSCDWHVKHVHGEEVQCSKCSHVAYSKSALKVHVQEVHDEKQHVCTECEQSFSFYHELRVHMTHHARNSVHRCAVCETQFTRAHELRQHMQSEHSSASTKLSCPECNFTCHASMTLKMHVSSHHPDLLDVPRSKPPPHSKPLDLEDSASSVSTDDEWKPTSEERSARLYSGNLTSPASHTGKRGRPRLSTSPPHWKGRQNMTAREQERELRTGKDMKRLKKKEKELIEGIRAIKKSTVSRSRTYGENQMLNERFKKKNAARGRNSSAIPDEIENNHVYCHKQDEKEDDDDDDDAATTLSSSSVQLPSFLNDSPYNEHSYCLVSQLQVTAASKLKRQSQTKSDNSKKGLLSKAPDVSAFQECETVLLGLAPSMQTLHAQSASEVLVNEPHATGQQRFSSVFQSLLDLGEDQIRKKAAASERASRTVKQPCAVDELSAEDDEMKVSPDYDILHDILGSPAALGRGGVARNQLFRSPRLPYCPRPVVGRSLARGLLEFGGNDVGGASKLAGDSLAFGTELDDIELCDADYSLWEGIAVSHSTSRSGANINLVIPGVTLGGSMVNPGPSLDSPIASLSNPSLSTIQVFTGHRASLGGSSGSSSSVSLAGPTVRMASPGSSLASLRTSSSTWSSAQLGSVEGSRLVVGGAGRGKQTPVMVQQVEDSVSCDEMETDPVIGGTPVSGQISNCASVSSSIENSVTVRSRTSCGPAALHGVSSDEVFNTATAYSAGDVLQQQMGSAFYSAASCVDTAADSKQLLGNTMNDRGAAVTAVSCGGDIGAGLRGLHRVAGNGPVTQCDSVLDADVSME